MRLTDSHKHFFIQNGYLHIPAVIKKPQLTELLQVTDHFYDTNQYKLHDSNKDILPHFPLSCEQHPTLTSLPRSTPIYSLCEQLLGAGNVALPGRAQIAYRPYDDRLAKRGLKLSDPIYSHWYHVDGGDGKYATTASPFTLLVGVCLSDQTVDENRGQLNVWPGTSPD